MLSAPILEYNGEKSKADNVQFYQLPQKLMDIIFSTLGNSSAQLRIMIVLIGTKPGFGISEKWILDRTGLTERSYERARDSLEQLGWIKHIPAKKIIIDYNAIYAGKPDTKAGKKKPDTIAGKENKTIKPDTIAGKAPDISAGNAPDTVAGIIDNGIDNNKEKVITAPQAQLSQIQEISRDKYENLIFYGNKIAWIDKENGIFKFNERVFKIAGWRQSTQREEPAKNVALNRPQPSAMAKGGQFVF